MKIKELSKISFASVKKYFFPSFLMCFFGTIVIGAILFLIFDLYIPILIIFVPLVFLPIFFSMMMSSYEIRCGKELKFSRQVKYVLAYFTNAYRGIFKVILTIFASLALGFVLLLLFSSIAEVICNVRFSNFQDIINKITEALKNDSLRDIYAIYNSYPTELNTYMVISALPPSFAILILVVYMFTSNGIYAYLRNHLPLINMPYFKFIIKINKKTYNNQIIGSYWGLNFPYFILLALGFALGGTICYFINSNFNLVLGSAFVGALFLSSFYLPIFFSNNETIFLSLKEDFLKSEQEFKKSLMERFNGSFMNDNKEDV